MTIDTNDQSAEIGPRSADYIAALDTVIAVLDAERWDDGPTVWTDTERSAWNTVEAKRLINGIKKETDNHGA